MEGIYVIKTMVIMHGTPDYEEAIAIDNDGVFPTLEEAIYAVEHNVCDLHDGINSMVILIAKVSFGCYPAVEEVAWYQWNMNKECFTSIPRPRLSPDFCFCF